MKIRALLVDDEERAIARLRQLCSAHPEVKIVGEAASGGEALEKIRALAPTLLFLDVHLGAMSGLDVLAALDDEELPFVIFVTAFESYAAAAFEREAVDYLLKPCSPERFAQALARAVQRIDRGARPVREELVAAWRELVAAVPPAALAARRDGLFVEDGGRYVFVELSTIDYVEAARNYVVIHVGKKSYLHRAAISALEQTLDTTRFARVHKSVIVNLTRVESIESDFNGTYVFRLACGASCRSGQSYRSRIVALLKPPPPRPAPAR